MIFYYIKIKKLNYAFIVNTLEWLYMHCTLKLPSGLTKIISVKFLVHWVFFPNQFVLFMPSILQAVSVNYLHLVIMVWTKVNQEQKGFITLIIHLYL